MRLARATWRVALASVWSLCGAALALPGCGEKAPAVTVEWTTTPLADSSVVFPIGSRKEIPLTVPYDGQLTAVMLVQRGETLAVRLIDQQEYSHYLGGREYRSRPEFDATYVREYKKTGPVTAGNYYLVIFDPTAADVAKHPFNDVSFKVHVTHARHAK